MSSVEMRWDVITAVNMEIHALVTHCNIYFSIDKHNSFENISQIDLISLAQNGRKQVSAQVHDTTLDEV
jgi:hypothetical protein